MTAPSKKDVDSMANILRAMSGDKSGLISEASNNQVQGNDNVDITPGVKKADIKAMENIMKNFQNATKKEEISGFRACRDSEEETKNQLSLNALQ